MKYESAILKRLIDTYGVMGNPKYISEIIKEFIVRGKERFPNLFTYQADWLAHIDEFGLSPSYTVSYTGQSIYAPNTLERPVKSAILKGSTKYHDIDTGEILEAFEEGRNLELVSVKMPVLTTTGKNLINSEIIAGWLNTSNGEINNLTSTTTCATKDLIKVKPAAQYSVYKEYDKRVLYAQFNEKQEFINFGTYTHNGFTTDSNAAYVRLFFETPLTDEIKVMLYEGAYNSVISYEPYKSNILTVNEEVTLRGIGEVQDTLDCLTGELIENTGIYTLTGDESFSFIERTDNYTSYGFVLPDYKKPKGGNSVDFICNLFKSGYAWGSNNAECIGYGVLWGKIVIRVEKSKLSTDTINGFSEFVRNNTITVVYPKTESIKTVDLTILDQNGQNVKQLMSFNGGTHFNTGSIEGSLLPTLEVSVETDLEETLAVCSLEGNTM